MKSICVFNNKGGVGKTTLLCNIASFFAKEKAKKVLVVDCDPQCNATAYMLSEPTLEKLYAKESGTINDLIRPLRRGKGFSKEPLPIIRSPGFMVDILPGDPRFSIAEDFLARDWIDATAGLERGLRTTLVFKELLNACGDYDFVFFDMGPSLGAINRTVLLASQLFILPVSSDIFSLRGFQNIEIAVTTWTKDLNRGLDSYEEKEGEKFELNGLSVAIPLRFLGYVTQQYTAKTVGGKRQPVRAYEKIIRRIEPEIQKRIVAVINQSKKLNYKLGEIPYLQSIVPLSQSACKPIFALGSGDGIVGAHFEKVRDFGIVIGAIARNIEENVGALK